MRVKWNLKKDEGQKNLLREIVQTWWAEFYVSKVRANNKHLYENTENARFFLLLCSGVSISRASFDQGTIDGLVDMPEYPQIYLRWSNVFLRWTNERNINKYESTSNASFFLSFDYVACCVRFNQGTVDGFVGTPEYCWLLPGLFFLAQQFL